MENLPKRKKIRLPKYNYSQNGVYFVTICIDKHKCVLWEKVVRKVGANCVRPPEHTLSDWGNIVEKEIAVLNNTYDYLNVDIYTIMPNHLHLLISISQDISGRTQFAPTISRAIKQFKGAVTKKIGQPIWQKSFYEHIIRNEKDYLTHWEYIENNPIKWETDDYYVN